MNDELTRLLNQSRKDANRAFFFAGLAIALALLAFLLKATGI